MITMDDPNISEEHLDGTDGTEDKRRLVLKHGKVRRIGHKAVVDAMQKHWFAVAQVRVASHLFCHQVFVVVLLLWFAWLLSNVNNLCTRISTTSSFKQLWLYHYHSACFYLSTLPVRVSSRLLK